MGRDKGGQGERQRGEIEGRGGGRDAGRDRRGETKGRDVEIETDGKRHRGR